jgi:hypothetical protein
MQVFRNWIKAKRSICRRSRRKRRFAGPLAYDREPRTRFELFSKVNRFTPQRKCCGHSGISVGSETIGRFAAELGQFRSRMPSMEFGKDKGQQHAG